MEKLEKGLNMIKIHHMKLSKNNRSLLKLTGVKNSKQIRLLI